MTSVDTFQVSMTYFLRSDKSRWHYPTPGRRVRAREVMRAVTQNWVKLKGVITGRRADSKSASVYS